MTYDIVIVGAGVVGSMLARALGQYECTVCVLEAANDAATGASGANSSIVHAGYDCTPGTLKALLNVRGAKMMERIASELGVPYRKNGSLVIGYDEEDRKTLDELLEKGRKNGVSPLSILSGEEARAIEPNLSEKVTCALYAPDAGTVCPYELTIAAMGNAMDNGAELIRNFRVTSIVRDGEEFVLSSDAGSVRAKTVVNCAGVHSDEIAAMAGACDFTVIPRRGEYMVLDREAGNTVSATIFRTPSAMGKGILVTQTVDGNLLLGPTAENMEDKTDTRTTAEGLAAVKRMAGEMVNGIAYGKVITSFTGLRAVGSTHDFILNRPISGFYNAAGIESPGLSSSPAIAEYLIDMMKKDGIGFREKERVIRTRRPFRFFKDMTVEEKNALIREKPAYGRIVCRCEQITEGEILDALTDNPRALDLDGVKRRTRSGMGRCGGGFCSPSVMELIAEKCGIPFEEVTKRGGESRLVFGKKEEV